MISKKRILVLIVIVGLTMIDLVSKYYFFDQSYLANQFVFQPMMNMGVSFSWQISYMLVIPITIVAMVAFFYAYQKKYFSDIVMVLLMAGTVGNLFDRVMYDGVRDFIVVFDWFVCNVADMYLSLAVLLVVRGSFFEQQSKL